MLESSTVPWVVPSLAQRDCVPVGPIAGEEEDLAVDVGQGRRTCGDLIDVRHQADDGG